MKTRTAGGVGIVLVGLGLLLGLIWKGPGLGGSGTKDKSAEGTPDTSNVKVIAEPEENFSASNTRPDEKDEPGAGENFVTVIIHGDGYRLISSSDPSNGIPITLDGILERVKSAPGSPEGIRLRILKDRTAQEGARSDLEAALRKAGIKLEEVQEISGFVE